MLAFRTRRGQVPREGKIRIFRLALVRFLFGYRSVIGARASRPVLARASSGIRGWFGRRRIRHLRHWPLDAVKLELTTARPIHPSIFSRAAL